ncbi:hypothetical protein TWF694_005591 [Orbilia ellipsospora]|uniref:Uncharacterized protein n=1 Tax=Orbilia ellipsospora TaxID=2528407 RepID=A0AAV9WV48_9PEZI
MTAIVEILLINLAANVLWQTVVAPRIFAPKCDPRLQKEDVPGLDGDDDAVMLDTFRPARPSRSRKNRSI